MPNLIITGLPRSGLTVAAALADSLPDSLCLNAPKWQMTRAKKGSVLQAYSKWLVGDFFWQRAQILREAPIMDYRAMNGEPLFDSIHDPRQPKDEKGEIEAVFLTRPGLSPDFLLGMKHTLLYTAILPRLLDFQCFGVIAVIRHPLDVIASWQRNGGFPVDKNTIPHVITFWPEALAIVESDADLLDRMVQFYDLHIQRYYELREDIRILKYEDIVQNPEIISQILGKTSPPDAGKIHMRSAMRMAKQTEPIRASLKKYGVYTKHYYPDV